MGRPKYLLRLGDRTLLGRVIEAFRRSNVGEVLVVIGPDSGMGRRVIGGARFVLNPDSSGGLSSSIRAGLSALRADSEAAIFGLADKPFITVRTINSLIKNYHESGRGIVIPVYRGRRGNPVLFGREFFGELSNLSGDVGGKSVIKSHKERVLEVDVDDEGILFDINTPEDYGRAKARLDQSRNRSAR